MLKFLIFFFIPIMLFAQEPRDYFPTHLGDMWQYKDSDGIYTNFTIIKDSTDPGGNEYVDFEKQYIGFKGSYIEHYFIDTLNQVWQFDNDYENGIFLRYDLKAKYGEWFFRGKINSHCLWVIVQDTTNTTKTYLVYETKSSNGNPDSMYIDFGLTTLTKGIGRTSKIGEFYSETLNGAIINGVQYGTIYYDTTAIEDNDISLLPQKPHIVKTYPNPFNGQVKIEYFLPNPGRLKIEIHNILGQKVSTLFNGYAFKGKKKIIWDGRLFNQQPAPSGLYFVQLYFNGVKIIKRILLIK